MKAAFHLLPLALAAHALDLNGFLSLIDRLFPDNMALRTADSVIGTAETTVGKVLGLQTTRDDLAAGRCGDVMVLFARGTAEPGNIGSLVGPGFLDALVSALSGREVAFTGVNASSYPASVSDYFEGGSRTGAEELARLVDMTKTSCPDTSIVMSGYSQGAQVVHKAAALVGSGMASLSSVVTFGDPDSKSKVTGIDSSKVLVICHDGDDICHFGDFLGLKHFTYAENVPQAASFVASNL